MKKSLKTIVVAVATVLTLAFCGKGKETGKGTTNESEKQEVAKSNDDLKSFMLAGIYTINGYDGIDAVVENVGDADETDSYTQLLQFPFEQGQEGVTETLSTMWNINSKEDLVKRLGDLLNDEKSKTKAWDYARLVNNVNMGYAANYLTKEEGKKWANQALAKAKTNFKNWDDYHKNFMEGRKAWNKDDEDTATFEELSKNISAMSVYKNNPLN